MITVRVPATSANLGTGFDTLGLALQLYLTVTAQPQQGCLQECRGGKPPRASTLLTQAIEAVFARAGQNVPALQLQIDSQIPIGKGLGSSAAVIIAGMYLANALLGNPYSEQHLLNWALTLEGHADNIVAAAVGGLTTAMVLEQQVYYQKVLLRGDLTAIIAVPDFILPTQEARSILPQQIPWRDCVRHMQQACFVLSSLANGDYRHLQLAMDDVIVQSLRKSLIPGLDQVLQTALDKGALGAALSGAGPSVLALAATNLDSIGTAMIEAFARHGCKSRCLYLKIDRQGVQVQNQNV